jgi:hypothetical protein
MTNFAEIFATLTLRKVFAFLVIIREEKRRGHNLNLLLLRVAPTTVNSTLPNAGNIMEENSSMFNEILFAIVR